MILRRFSMFSIAALVASLAAAQEPPVPEAEEPVVELTLEQAIQMALENNLDIVVSRLGTQVQSEGVTAARGAYKPSFTLAFNNFDSRQPANNQLAGAQAVSNTQTAYNFAWEQLLPTGGTYQVGFENTRATTNSTFFTFNPRYDSALGASVSQPLLKDLRFHPARQRVIIAQNNERFSRHQFETNVMDVVQEVQNAYWDLVFAIRDLAVARSSLELAQDLLRNNRIQVEVGTMAPIDVLEAEAEVAAREEAVILAEQAIQRNEDNLNRLIGNPDAPGFWDRDLRPVDSPTEEVVTIDVEGAVATALERRPELYQSRVELDSRNYNVRYTRNQMLPQVNLVGSVFFNGLGGDRILREGFGGEVIEEIPGGYRDALDQLFGGTFRDWNLGLNVSYPLGNSAADAAHAQAQVEASQQRALIQNQELVIAQQVREAARQVETNRKRIEATQVARDLARRRLEAEEKKFEVGMSTSFFIVQAQRDLAQAEANELRAVIDYNKAIVNFERARGTLLDRNNISVR